MENAAIKTASLFNDIDGTTFEFNFTSIPDLMTQVSNHLSSRGIFPSCEDDLRVTLPDGTAFYWCPDMDNYCFGKGRISEYEAFAMMMCRTINSRKEATL